MTEALRLPSAGLLRAAAAAALALALAGCMQSAPAPEPVPPFYQRLDQGASLDAEAAASMINAYRARKGLAPLTLDPELSRQARERAAGVAQADTSTWGETPVLVAASAGKGEQRAERVSAGYRTMAEAFSGWRDSPPHDRVMLAPFGTRLGIAAVDRPGTKYRVYWDLIVAGPAR